MAADAIGNIHFDDVRSMHILAALSGGADSVALVHLLHRHADAYNLKITAAHFHHGIRGEQADADAQFCRKLCKGLEIELIEGRADVLLLARESGQGLETAAREARYTFLRAAMAQCGADVIALAHHMDDQAETVLMHLMRGAGPEGACGMARLKDGLYRPLLDIAKAQLVQFLENEAIPWREDATNAVSDNPRNALRLNVLPEIEKSYPSAAKAIARYARAARIESDYIAREAERFLRDHLERGPYGQRLLLDGSEDEALVRRSIRKICGSGLDAEKTDALVVLVRKKRGKMEINANLLAERTPGALYFLPKAMQKPAPVELKIPGETTLDGICRILAEPGNFSMDADDPYTEIFDAAALEGACLRTRREGDRIYPLGAPGEKLLSDYLTDKKIDRPLREFLPLIANEGNIIWACGTGMTHAARVKNETQRIVRLTIKPITDEKPEE